MRFPARLILYFAAWLAASLVLAASADARADNGLCKSNTSRGAVPAKFFIDACFDGKTLDVYNNSDVVLHLTTDGVGAATRTESDYELPADTVRLKTSDRWILVPGDLLKIPIGSAAALVSVSQASPEDGDYRLAEAIEALVPFATAAKDTAKAGKLARIAGKADDISGKVDTFAGLIDELNADYLQYSQCLSGVSWLAQLGCRALLVRNVDFAYGRAALDLGAKGLELLLSPVEFIKYVHDRVEEANELKAASTTISLTRASTTPEASATTTATPTTTETSSTASSFVPTSTWTWSTINRDGYTSNGEFAVGTPDKASSVPLLPGFSDASQLTDTCSGFDPETDALLPARLVMTNTTNGFTNDVTTSFNYADNGAYDVVSGVDPSPECDSMQNVDESAWNVECQLAIGASCTTFGYIILSNYYSPATPDGDPSVLDNIQLQLESSYTDPYTFHNVSGPRKGLLLHDGLLELVLG